MATIERTIAELGGGQCFIKAFFEDGAAGAPLALIKVEGFNGSLWQLRVTVTEEARARQRSITLAPGELREVTIPNTNPQRLAVARDLAGRFTGLSWELAWAPELL